MLRAIEYFVKSLKIVENGTVWELEYGFLFAFHSNYGRTFTRFDTIHERDRQTDSHRHRTTGSRARHAYALHQGRRSHRSWGVMTPHFSRQRGTGGHNLGIIHISHIAHHAFTLTSTLCRLYPGVWRITPSTISDWRPVDSEITAISPVRGNEDNHKVNVENTKITTENISISVSQLQIKQSN